MSVVLLARVATVRSVRWRLACSEGVRSFASDTDDPVRSGERKRPRTAVTVGGMANGNEVPMTTKVCQATGCGNQARTLIGTCQQHRGSAAFFLRPEPGPLDSDCLVFVGQRDRKGYGRVQFDGRLQPSHRVTWEIMNGPIPDGLVVRHECDNAPCCNPDHLRLGTVADNAADMLKRGRQATGERNGSAKLTDDAVRAIRERYAAGGVTHRVLGAEYGVSPVVIGLIVRRETWKHVQ